MAGKPPPAKGGDCQEALSSGTLVGYSPNSLGEVISAGASPLQDRLEIAECWCPDIPLDDGTDMVRHVITEHLLVLQGVGGTAAEPASQTRLVDETSRGKR
jgi:hypothetical protein